MGKNCGTQDYSFKFSMMFSCIIFYILFYVTGEVYDVKKSIDAFENVLLRDLKNMKYRQVIHPVLQAGIYL